MNKGEKSVLEVSVDDVMLVDVVNSIENRADDSGRVVLGKLDLCEDAVKELSAGGEFERNILCATQSPRKTWAELG